MARRPAPRVLHVVVDYGAYSETFVTDTMLEVEAVGWEAWLLTRSVVDGGPGFPPAERVIKQPQRPLAARALDVLVARPPRIWARASLEDAVDRVRPAVVHAHFGWATEEARSAARAAGAPLCVSFHGADVTLYPRFPAWELPRRLLRRERHRYERSFTAIDQAFVPSPVVEATLRELGYRGPVEVLPPGVRLAEFPLRAARPPGDAPVLLFVGRVVRRKGLDVLVRALPVLAARWSDVSLRVCGDGPERERCAALARELGVDGRVSFLGVCERSRVREELAHADALVLPSRTMPTGEVETLGVVILEALATGVPVVATRSGGIPSALPPELRDELAPEDDAGALAARLDAVLSDPNSERRRRLGRDWVEQNYDWSRLARRMATVYERALAARSG